VQQNEEKCALYRVATTRETTNEELGDLKKEGSIYVGWAMMGGSVGWAQATTLQKNWTAHLC